MSKSSIRRSHRKQRERLASRDVAADLSQVSAKHDLSRRLSTRDASSLPMERVGARIFAMPSTLARASNVELNYSHTDLQRPGGNP
jgi:hypothetical protein